MNSERSIKNDELKLEHVPRPDAELLDIGRFAGTFDAKYQEHHTLLEEAIKNHFERGILPDSLTELRICLALEWTMLPYISLKPSAKQEQFLRDVVAKIRSKLLSGETDSGGKA